jgi:hypothetical protein
MVHIEANFPGGNIICGRVDDSSIWLRQNWSTSTEWWFYWHFRVHGAAGKTLRFHFIDGHVFGAHGPASNGEAFNVDWQSWLWLGREVVHTDADSLWFEYSFPDDCNTPYFSFCIPYVESHLMAWLQQHPSVQRNVLTQSEGGRAVERLTLASQRSTYIVLIVARSHACESMANYVIEGIMEFWLQGSERAASFYASTSIFRSSLFWIKMAWKMVSRASSAHRTTTIVITPPNRSTVQRAL